jgi:signal peptidase I
MVRAEEEQPTETQEVASARDNQQAIREFLIKLVLVCLALWATFTFVFGIRQMNGDTMYPRLMDGDLMLYYRLEQNYFTGDVVTFKINGYNRTARIVAMGGDVVSLSDSGQLIVNGNVQSEEIFYETDEIAGGVEYPYTVPEDSYFVLCDFRTNSSDSRSYGAIPKSELDGKVITIVRRREI